MRARKTLAALSFALTLGTPALASAMPIPIGTLVFDTFVGGPGGTSALFVSNLTGDPAAGGFALDPDFPVVTSLDFTAPRLEWTGTAPGSFDFGGVSIAPGFHDPDPQLQFPDTDQMLSARFTAVLSQATFLLADGRLFGAASNAIDFTMIGAAGSLAPGDFALITVDADEIVNPPDPVPEPGTLTLLAVGLAAMTRRFRRA